MSESILRKASTGEAGNPGQFGSHSRDAGAVTLDEDTCAAVGHLLVGDELPYCVRCHEEFPELSTMDGTEGDPDGDGHEPYCRPVIGGEPAFEAPAIDRSTVNDNEELLKVIPVGKVVGYRWRGRDMLPGSLVEAMITAGELSPTARDLDIDRALHQYRQANALDPADAGAPQPLDRTKLQATEDLSWMYSGDQW